MESGLIFQYIGLYLVAGIVILALFDLLTSRIRKRLRGAAVQAQADMASRGNYSGTKSAIVMVTLAIWMFWPLVISSAVLSLAKKGDNNGESKPQ